MDEPIETLKESRYFEGLPDQQLSQISALAKTLNFSRGQELLVESDPGDQVFLITQGRVTISVSLVGRDEIEPIATVGPREMVGEMILLGKSRRSANVTAKDDVTVLSWHSGDLLELFEKDARIGFVLMRNVARHMAERLVSANQVLRNALTLPHHNVF